MENLIDVLDRESTEYEALLQLSQRKTPIIASGNLAELQKITDEEQELATQFNVMSIPSLFVIKNGKVSNQSVGVIPKNQILELL